MTTHQLAKAIIKRIHLTADRHLEYRSMTGEERRERTRWTRRELADCLKDLNHLERIESQYGD